MTRPIELAQEIEDMAYKAIRFPQNREAYLRDIRRQAKELVRELKKEGGTHDHQ